MICRCHLKLSKDSYQEKNDSKLAMALAGYKMTAPAAGWINELSLAYLLTC